VYYAHSSAETYRIAIALEGAISLAGPAACHFVPAFRSSL